MNLLREELQQELADILQFWIHHTVDHERGGFYGRIDGKGTVHHNAEKGSVLNARILWTFSRAGSREAADRAFTYLSTKFIDKEYGGVYWTVDASGRPAQTRKQIYAQAFAVYALAEYHKLSGDLIARGLAIALFQVLEAKGHDPLHGGYFEAFDRDWSIIEDQRLSDKDANEKKSMNTHLHVLEGYANLYTIWPDPLLRQRLIELLDIFHRHILHPATGHLQLFFTETWELRGEIISYGHDIEAGWLLLEAAEIIGDKGWIKVCRDTAITLTDAAMEGLDGDGGMWYEKEQDVLIKEKHWWVQAEAMVGFYNAWQLTNDETYLLHAYAAWEFIKRHIIDSQGGEWFWGVDDRYQPLPGDKAGLWKCPYHNGRACMELMRRLSSPAVSDAPVIVKNHYLSPMPLLIKDVLAQLEHILYGYNYQVTLGVELFENCQDMNSFKDALKARLPDTRPHAVSPVPISEADFLEEIELGLTYRGDEHAGLKLTPKKQEKFDQLQKDYKDFLSSYIHPETKFYIYPDETGIPGYPVFWDYRFIIASGGTFLLVYGSSSD